MENMQNKTTIGAKILSLRKAKGITQADLGIYLNISYQAVSKWERDESCPDFDTLSRIAQFFGVPISYFEKGGEEVAVTAAKTATPAQPSKEMLGVCKDCGKVVYEENVALKIPSLVCKECDERRKRIAAAKAEQAKRDEEKRKKEMEYKAAERREKILRSRNKGLIWGAIVAGIVFVFSFFSAFTAPRWWEGILGGVLLTGFIFTFVSQLFWDGAIVTCATAAAHIGTPGVIFDLSLDGFIFLIVMKIAFALLRGLVAVLSWIVCVIVAILISPFTFVPALKRVNSGDLV